VDLLFRGRDHSVWTDGERWDWTINYPDGTPIEPRAELLHYPTLDACLADCPEPLRRAYLAANPQLGLRPVVVAHRKLDTRVERGVRGTHQIAV